MISVGENDRHNSNHPHAYVREVCSDKLLIVKLCDLGVEIREAKLILFLENGCLIFLFVLKSVSS